uniref:Uncharacterized protein n=1 Tax=Anguilla anguilla TaxID=7936 RepID=A0A0E9QLK8_ANGAN
MLQEGLQVVANNIVLFSANSFQPQLFCCAVNRSSSYLPFSLCMKCT